MSLRPVVVENFPGLDLRTDPGDSRGAIDLMNVTLEPGRVRSRDGTSLLFNATNATVTYAQTFNRSTPHLIAVDRGNPPVTYAVNPSGTVVGTSALSAAVAAVSDGGVTGAAIGTPAGSFFYLTHPASIVKRWDGATWTSPAGFPATIRVLATSPTDNRLVACQALSKVSFSDPGAPETFGANNYVLLTPGDGEEIQSAVVYNNQLFVFKQSKFFVFYGNSTDATGSPIFNYRAVDTGVGVHPAPSALSSGATGAVCATPDGVYFVGNDGVYRTTGGPPVKVSAPLDPFFAVPNSNPPWRGLSPFWSAGVVWQAVSNISPRMTWLDGKVYIALATITPANGLVLVYDTQRDAWSAWGLWAQALATLPMSSTDGDRWGLVLGPRTGTAVLRTNPELTADNGAAIVSRYRLPFETYGDPRQKRIRETILEGTGTPTVQWSDDWSALGTGSAVTLGTSPAIAAGRQRLAQRGRAFSLQLGAASGAWAVNRVQVNIHSELRPAAVTI